MSAVTYVDVTNEKSSFANGDFIIIQDASASGGTTTEKFAAMKKCTLQPLKTFMGVGISAAEYSSSSTYAVGDYCLYNAALYKCTTAITTAEDWTAGHWTATTVVAELQLKINISDIKNNLTSTDTDKPLSAYQGKVLYDGKVDKVTGKGLSTNDYDATEKALVASALQPGNVINNLTSTETTKPLSAYQGKVLNESINDLDKSTVKKDSNVETYTGTFADMVFGQADADNAKQIIQQLSTEANSAYTMSVTSTAPASMSATGSVGQVYFDTTNSYMYVCIASNSWKRIALSDF